jgi:septum formation topological specificity factor MinE
MTKAQKLLKNMSTDILEMIKKYVKSRINCKYKI